MLAYVQSLALFDECQSGAWQPLGSPVNVKPEPAGANCPAGGQAITVGIAVQYVCNGTAGQTGSAGSTEATGAVGAPGLSASGFWMYDVYNPNSASINPINLKVGVTDGNTAYLADVRLTTFSDGSAFVAASGVNTVGTAINTFANSFFVPAKTLMSEYFTFEVGAGTDPDGIGGHTDMSYQVTLGQTPTLKAVVDGVAPQTIPLTQMQPY